MGQGILTLTFNKDIAIGKVDATKIVLANSATGGETFSLGMNEITPQADGRVVKFTLTASHRETINRWKILYVQLKASAVKDRYGNTNAAMAAWQEVSIL